jgi:cytosine/uracil/thiamine/allantoin permease
VPLTAFLAPWLDIYGGNWLLRRGKYDASWLLNATKTSRYWGSGAFNLAGIVAQIDGTPAACLWFSSPGFVGPLSSRTQGSDFSFFMGIAVSSLIYLLLGRAKVRKQVSES